MSSSIDPSNFHDLAACDPEQVVSRTGCRYDRAKNQYRLMVWGHPFIVDLNRNQVKPQGPGSKTDTSYLHLFILYFLMKSKDIPPLGTWVSEKDIPGGAGFFRGPHTIPVEIITNQFKNDLDLFKKRGQTLGGFPMDLADAAFLFQITQSIPIAVLYWQGDEDFPSQARLLFDKTIPMHLPLDIIYALAVDVCRTVGKSFLM